MSIRDDLHDELDHMPEVVTWAMGDTYYHGEKAVFITVTLSVETTETSRMVQYVEGTFTVEDKAGFGGVAFTLRKDIAKLMSGKVRAVLSGTADLT